MLPLLDQFALCGLHVTYLFLIPSNLYLNIGRSSFWGDNVIRMPISASLEERCSFFIAALTGKLRFSLWLLPARGTDSERGANLLIKALATSSKLPDFTAHISLGPPFMCLQRDAVAKVEAAAAAIGGLLEVHPSGECTLALETPFRALVAEMNCDEPLMQAYSKVCAAIGAEESSLKKFAPHVSLLYGGNHSQQFLDSAKKLVQEDSEGKAVLTETFIGQELAVVMCSGDRWENWYEVHRVSLDG